MNIMQVAVLLIRLSSLSWFVEAGILLTYMPNDIFGARSLPPGYLASQRELSLVMMLARFLIYGVLGMIFNIYAVPVARLFTKGLEDLQSGKPAEEAWPPAPRPITEQTVTKPGESSV